MHEIKLGGITLKELAQIASAVQVSSTMAMDALAKQMKADGVDVIGFGAGEPDFNTPDHIKAAAERAIAGNMTRYTPASGTPDLKEAVCLRMREDCGLDYQPSQVVVTSGAKHCVYIALRTLVDPDDEVILPAPFWVSYLELIKMMGAKPVVVSAGESSRFKMTAEQLAAAITPKTKALILNNPCNPTGMAYSREELSALARVCVERDIYIISDEIYCNLMYDGARFTSAAALGQEVKERAILINGVSKSYAMTGWRIGYLLSSERIAKVMASCLSHSTGSPSSISQAASVAALTGPQNCVEEMRRAFYVMMNMEQQLGRTLCGETVRSSDDFCSALLRHGLVATVPGSGMGAPGFVRWSYAVSMDNIKRGMDRLEKFLMS